MKYGARLTADMKIVVTETIPFGDFDAVWYFDEEANKARRLMTPVGETQFVCSIAKCKKVADTRRMMAIRDKVLHEAVPEDKEIVDRIRELDKQIERKILSIKHGTETWNEMVSLLALAYSPTQSGHILCPGCLRETPSVFSLCIHCEGVLMSHGCRQSIVQEEDKDQVHETTIPAEPVIEVQEHVKEAMNQMHEDGTDIEMTDDLPEETPQIKTEDADEDDEAEEVATDASGMRRKMQYAREEEEAINSNIGAASDTTDIDDPATALVYVDSDEADPFVTLRIEQFAEEPARCLDAQRRASMIMDLQVGCILRDIFHIFYLRYVGGHSESIKHCFDNKPNNVRTSTGNFHSMVSTKMETMLILPIIFVSFIIVV